MFTKKQVNKAFSVRPITVAVVAALLSSGVAAQGQGLYSFSAPWYGNVDMTPYATNNFELGVGYSSTSGNTYRASEWSGLPATDSALVLGRFNYSWLDGASGSNYSAYGQNLGLDTRSVGVSGGLQGVWNLYSSYDQLLHRNTNNTTVIYDGLGSDNLTLVPGFTPGTGNDTNTAGIQAHGYGFGVKTDRQTIRLGGGYLFNGAWGITSNYRYDKREGTYLTAMRALIGGNNNIIAPAPIDDVTQQVDLALNYSSKSLWANLGYYYSKYSNNYDSVTLQSPWNGATNRTFSLAPDNHFHQIKADAAYNLTNKSRISTLFQYGMQRQNQEFLPYSFGPNNGSSLDGKINNTLFDVTLNSREINNLGLKLQYQFKERDDQTPQYLYNYTGTGTRYNPVFSTKEHKLVADADYRITRGNSLRGWYEFSEKKASDAFESLRGKTETNQYGVELRSRSSDWAHGRVQYVREERRGSEFERRSSNAFTVVTRQYNVADYDQDKVRASVDFFPIDALALQLAADWTRRDFRAENCGGLIVTTPNATICRALNSTDRLGYTADVQYAVLPSLNLYSFYSFAQYKSKQDGPNSSSSTTFAQLELTNDDHTVGVGFNFKPEKSAFEVGSQYLYAIGKGKYSMVGNYNVGSPIPSPNNELSKYTTQSVQTYARWHQSDNLSYAFEHQYQQLRAKDWAYDLNGMMTGTGNVILSGTDSGSHTQNFFGLSVRYTGF